MSFYVLANDIISALSKTKIPVYHQFGEELLARRNDCFVTVGITEFISDEEKSEATATVSLYAPYNFSGGKILSLATKIPEAIIKSTLDIKSVKATSFCYDKKLDRLRYDFSLRIYFNAVENKENTVNILDSEVRVTAFSFVRKCAVSEVPAINSKVITTMGGRYPIKLDIAGKISACKKSFFNLDEAVRTGEVIRIKLSGAVFPDMKLKSYEVKYNSGRTAYVEMELTATTSEEGIK